MKSKILLFFIILLGATLRFYRLPEMANFDFDQEFASNFAYSIIKEFPVTLIGQGLSIQGLFMGPWYFYFLVPFFFFTGLHPIGGAIGSVVFGLIIIWAFYYVGKKLFSVQAGLIAAFLRAVNFFEIEHDWAMVPSYSSALLVLLTWWLFYRYWKGEAKILPWITLLLGLYTSIHPILFPFYLVFIFLLLIKRKLPSRKIAILSIIAFLAPISPLLLFEYFRKFAMTKQLWSMLTNLSSTESLASTRFTYFSESISKDIFRNLGLEAYSITLLTSILIVISLFLLIKKKLYKQTFSFHYIMLPLTVATFMAYYSFFPAHVPEYYLVPVTILAWLYISALLGELAKNNYGKILIIIFLISIALLNFNLLKVQKWQHENLITLAHKDKIARAIAARQAEGDKFFVSYIAEPGWNFGFNYLFKLYERIPETKAVNDTIYTIVIPKGLSPDSINIDSGNVGLILPDYMK